MKIIDCHYKRNMKSNDYELKKLLTNLEKNSNFFITIEEETDFMIKVYIQQIACKIITYIYYYDEIHFVRDKEKKGYAMIRRFDSFKDLEMFLILAKTSSSEKDIKDVMREIKVLTNK